MKHSNHFKFVAAIAAICVCVAAPSLSAATIPAGTTLSVKTKNQISDQDPRGRTFRGQLDQDVVVNGTTVLKAGTAVTGRITASRSSSRGGRGSGPLSVALTSVRANGSNVAIKTANLQPQAATMQQNAQMRTQGVTTGSVLLPAGSTMQFTLSQAVTF